MTLRNTIEDLLCEYFSGDQGKNTSADTFLFLTSLVHCGCDGFEIINRVSICVGAGNYVNVFQCLVDCIHPSQQITTLQEKNLRGMIPRWTGTKYHTANINIVVSDIHDKISGRKLGIYSYHSNRNPRRNTVDDPYILLVGKEKAVFLDINRKRSFFYSYPEGGENCDSVGHL